MSNSPDPQTWVFPPLGAAVLPHDASAAFGPISRGDKIQLEWAPASSTPEVGFICANGGGTYLASNGNTSPATYTFDQSIDNGTSHICWFFFPGTKLGNTLTFEYNNAEAGSSTLWQQNSQMAQALAGGGSNNNGATTIISTVTQTKTLHVNTGGDAGGTPVPAAATTVLSIETVTEAPHTLLTTIANPSTTFVSTSVELLAQNTVTSTPANAATEDGDSSSPSGLSAGAAAGITVGAVVGLALLVLAIWALLRRRRPVAEGYVQGQGNMPYTPGLLGAASPGTSEVSGPVLVPSTYKYQPPMEVQGQSLAQGYYSPVSGAAEAGSKERPLPAAPRRTIHEMAD